MVETATTMATAPEQLAFDGMLDELRSTALRERTLEHIRDWKICWDWEGPVAGELCECANCCQEVAERFTLPHGKVVEPGEQIYSYGETVRLIEPIDGAHWLGRIEMEKPDWPTNGLKLRLHLTDIWPPTRQLAEQRG